MLFISKKAAGVAFVPSDLTNMLVWYDPSDLSTMYTDDGVTNVTADGDAVYRIDDKSGNGYHLRQTTLANRPLYKTAGGLHWLQWDGTDCLRAASGVDFSAFGGLTSVCGAGASNLSDGIIWEHNTFINTGFYQSVWRVSKFQDQVRNDSNQVGGRSTGTLTAGNDYVCTTVFDHTATTRNAAFDIRIDGVVSDTTDIGTAFTDDTTSFGTGQFEFGSRNKTFGTDERIYGLIIYGGQKAVSDLTNLESWMAAKSGVTL